MLIFSCFLLLLALQWMPYKHIADSFHTKKLCSRLCSSKVQFDMENGRFAFLKPPFGGLWQRRMFILGSLESA